MNVTVFYIYNEEVILISKFLFKTTLGDPTISFFSKPNMEGLRTIMPLCRLEGF